MIHVGILGDIRSPEARDALVPHLQSGVVWEDAELGDYGFKLVDGKLSLGSAAFAMLAGSFPDAPKVRKSDFN